MIIPNWGKGVFLAIWRTGLKLFCFPEIGRMKSDENTCSQDKKAWKCAKTMLLYKCLCVRNMFARQKKKQLSLWLNCLILKRGPARAWTWDLQIMSLLLSAAHESCAFVCNQLSYKSFVLYHWLLMNTLRETISQQSVNNCPLSNARVFRIDLHLSLVSWCKGELWCIGFLAFRNHNLLIVVPILIFISECHFIPFDGNSTNPTV